MNYLKHTLTLLTLIISFFAGTVETTEAYTRLTAGAVWDEERMLEEFGSPKYTCITGSSCQNNNSASVVGANNNATNRFLAYKCVDGVICQDVVHTELKYIKSIIGPGSRLGAAMIPSVTSFRVFNSQGEDVTYDSCVQPGEKLEFILSSEHRTCGTRALMTHYEIRFADQSAHVVNNGYKAWRYVNNFSSGFDFTAPLEEGLHNADITILNPINPWYYNRGYFADGDTNWNASVWNARIEYMRNNPRASYYSYELGKHTVNVCRSEDNALRASCFASPIQVLPNTEVTFTGKAAGGVEPYTFTWADGVEGDSRTETYGTVGSHSQRILVRDGAGNSAESTCAASVVSDLSEGSAFTDGSGWAWSFGDAFVPLGEINSFGADRLVTNDSCAFEWETTGMDSCRILRANGDFEEVPVTGTKDLDGGGTYTLECVDAYSAESITSQPVRCTQNPNIREI